MHLGKSMIISERHYQLSVYIDKQNQRVRVDDYLGSFLDIVEMAEQITEKNQAEKLIFKARKEHFQHLLEKGYRFEAKIDGYFVGSDCWIFSKFFSDARKTCPHWVIEEGIVKNVYHLERNSKMIVPPNSYILKKMKEEDASELALLYKNVFQVYPTPLNDKNYIVDTMNDGTVYYGFLYHGKVVSAASAEMNEQYKNAELTDCATLKEHRKHGLMKILLEKLEDELVDHGIYCAYSIARALSFGMNAVLFQLGYGYRGRLINNVLIYDKIENMNVWTKDLGKAPKSRH